MKTTKLPHCLFAMVAIGLAGTACAQQASSVTVYGLIDASVGHYKGGNTGALLTDTAKWMQEGGSMSGSMFGFRGTEDLGDGLSANFDLSGFIRNDTGQSGRSDAVGGDPFWSRMAWVGLRSASLGQVRLGVMTNLLFLNSVTSNAFGDSGNFSPLVLVTHIGAPINGGTSWRDTVAYDSSSLGGFFGSAAVGLGEGRGGKNVALRGRYAAGPLALSAAWQNVQRDGNSFADGGNTPAAANNVKSFQLAASYDFQVVKIFGHVGRIKSDGSGTPVTTDDNITHKIWELSASVPVGAGRILAGYAARKGNEAIGASERRVAALGYDYDVSKRTDVYVVARSDKNRLIGAPTDATGNAFAIGVRHTF